MAVQPHDGTIDDPPDTASRRPPSSGATTRSSPDGRPRAVGFDFDGTLTLAGRPDDGLLAAIAHARSTGIAAVLVTGRILAELLTVFADVGDHFDALVVENGALVELPARRVRVATPIDRGLTDALAERGVAHRRGEVIVAASAADEHAIVDELTRSGFECQLIHNRTELMILPSGVNKGTGFVAALDEVGVSAHDSVAIGDAENDHSFLQVAELGVAVANAVDSLLTAADLVLDEPDGAGIAALLDDLVGPAVHWRGRRRRQLVLGHDAEGHEVRLPTTPRTMVITGGSGDGKSYLAGLIAEQLVAMHYSILVVDPEGDHVGLDRLGPAVVLGDDGPPPTPDVVVGLLKRHDACVVIDLSGLSPADRRRYLEILPAAVESGRRAHGRPHWIIVDEAHSGFASETGTHRSFDLAASGFCLVTWRPQDLSPPVVASADIVLALTAADPDPDAVELVAAVSGERRTSVAELLTGPPGNVVVASRERPHTIRVARIAPRHTEHFRHEHKYDAEGTPVDRGFWMRDHDDHLTGTVARSLHELELELARCDVGVIRHHSRLGDISRWIGDVFHDRELAAAVAAVELQIERTSPDAMVDAARVQMVRALNRRRHTHPG